jgi:hypothetical protein
MEGTGRGIEQRGVEAYLFLGEDEDDPPTPPSASSSEVEARKALPVNGSLLRACRSCISGVNFEGGGLPLLLEAMARMGGDLQETRRN